MRTVEFYDIWQMKRFKILHLSSEKSWRGGEQQIAYLLKYSREHNVDAAILSRKGTPMSDWCKQNDFQFEETGFKNGLDLSTALKIKSYAVQIGADAIHVHSGKGHSLAYLSAKLGLKTPIIVHRRVDFELKSSGPSLRKYNHPSVKAIICVSDTIRKMVQKKIESPNRAQTVYSGIDFSRFTYPKTKTGFLNDEFAIPSAKLLVANISALAPHKDYPTFLKAVKAYSKIGDDCHFLIVGDGKLRAELEDLSRSLGIGNLVTFTGFRKDIPQVFQELDLFLITSETEGLGTTVIDALYHGLPVIATKGGGIPELVRMNKEGVLSEVGDSQSIAEAIDKLAKNEMLRTEMGNCAHQRSQSFSSDAMGQGVLNVYKAVLHGDG